MLTSRGALALKSLVSVLGSLGSGASGGIESNNLAQTNAAPIGPNASVHWDSSSFVSRTGRVLIIGSMALSKNGGTLAAGDSTQFALVRDVAGVPITVGGPQRAGGVTTGGDVTSDSTLAFIDTVIPGSTHTYSISAIISGGHTGGILTGEATIVVIDL